MHGVEKSRARALKHGKCIFILQGKYERMRTIILNSMMQKRSRVVQMITANKSFPIIYIFERLEQKIKLLGSGTQYSKTGVYRGIHFFLFLL